MTQNKVIKWSGGESGEAREFLRKRINKGNFWFPEYGLIELELGDVNKVDTSFFKDYADVPVFECSRNNSIKPRYALAKVGIKPENFLTIQAKMFDVTSDYTDLRDKSHSEQKLNHVKKGIKKKHTVPTPVLEFDKEGNLNTQHQEGRHRGLAMLELDETYMPVFLAKEINR